MKCEKGSITVFSALSILLITAALFALLEGTRLQEINRFADLQTESALESAFASYNTCLWEVYHLLGVQEDNLEKELLDVADGRIGEGTNLLQLRQKDMKIKSSLRLTDAQGKAFIRNVAMYMQKNWVYETAKEIYSQYEAIKDLMESSSLDKENIGQALQEIENAQSQKQNKAARTKSTGIDVKQLLEDAEKWQEHGILNLVIKDTDLLSHAKEDFGNAVTNRKLEKGTKKVEEITWQESILFRQYLMTYMSNYQTTKENHALSYEVEYLLGGKSSDIENLKVVVTELLAIRESVNFAYLVSNQNCVAQAEAAALLIAGTSLNSVIISVVKIGILTAWALAESILDVRALLAGKRIPVIKNEETWTTKLENLNEVTSEYAMAKESKWGFKYEEYLTVLLLMLNDEVAAMRTMNVQEATIQNVYDDMEFRMDTLLIQAEAEVSYSYKPVFPFLSVMDAQNRWEYSVLGEASYGYY